MRKDLVLAVAPLMIVPVVLYDLLVVTLPGGMASRLAHASLTRPLLRLATTGGGEWPISPGDLLLMAALVTLFVELVKSTASRRLTMINHGLSMVVFAICLAEMLLAPACVTSTFFLVSLMVLLDVLVGFIIRAPASRAAN